MPLQKRSVSEMRGGLLSFKISDAEGRAVWACVDLCGRA